MTILDEIIQNKKSEIVRAKTIKPFPRIQEEAQASLFKPRGFRDALDRHHTTPAIIAEIKKKSPSKGVLKEPLDASRVARSYEQNGAAALSVLTDEKFFGGSLEDLRLIRNTARIPILRKDFVLDEYQIYESLVAGADAVLLIAAILTNEDLRRLKEKADSLRMDTLIEIHTEKDLQKLQAFDKLLIGINNRDLRTFQVDLSVTEKLLALLDKKHCIVSESGIRNHDDLVRLREAGVNAVLVGESLVAEKDPGEALKKLIGLNHG